MNPIKEMTWEWKHDKLAFFTIIGVWVMFFWLIIPARSIMLLVIAYKTMGRLWFILTVTNFIASGIAISVWLPTIMRWSWCG